MRPILKESPAAFTLGNVSRTLPDVRNPGLRNLDVSLFKIFTVRETLHVEFRAESFNLTNTPNIFRAEWQRHIDVVRGDLIAIECAAAEPVCFEATFLK